MTDSLPQAALTPDVVVVGDGVVGLCCALALADEGHRVTLVGADLPGQASRASAGMLAPSVEPGWGSAHQAGLRARDDYPAFVASLEERTGITVPLDRGGILQLALDENAAEAIRAGSTDGAPWLDRGELARLEPALAPGAGALFHPHDGSVDNRELVRALEHAVVGHRKATILSKREGPALAVVWTGERPAIRTRTRTIATNKVVLAAGAWSGSLDGLPRPLPVEPVRGQMIGFGVDSAVRRVVYGPEGYLVPRAGCTWAGSTMERVGFAAETTEAGLAAIRAASAAICPPLSGAPEVERWAGLRPVTPDLLPIIGADPERPDLIYACGHSRNGILLAPLTGACVAAIVSSRTPAVDIAPFSPSRFDA